LSRLDKVGLSLFILVLFAFGVITEIRSAFQVTRRTDFGVYVRAAWAVTAGKDLYTVTDDHGWHYCYPPTFAILLVPLAEPYQFDTQTRHLPFAVSVAIWYVLSVGCAAFAANALASGVVPGAVRWSRRWWYARLVPVYVCIGGVGFTLGRGQVNLLLIALVAGAFAATVRGRRVASGAWLAGAAALKMIPALLVLFPLVRRDWRALIGVALGGFVIVGGDPGHSVGNSRKPSR
jgi:alpha-1,2-mannosyltransferase